MSRPDTHMYQRVRTLYEGRPVFNAEIPCQSCDRKWTMRITTTLPDEVIHKHITRDNWAAIGRGKYECPSCQAEKKAVRREAAQEKGKVFQMGNSTMEKPGNMAAVAAISNAAQMRKVIEALQIAFDEKRKVYRDGYDDAKVAKEIGVSEEFVTAIRREAFGELAMPPEISAALSELANVRSAVSVLMEDFNKRIRDLNQRLGENEARVQSYLNRNK